MANEAKPGNYEGSVSDYGIGKTKADLPMAMIRFQFEDSDNDTHYINWYGSFKEGKAAEITAEALAVCGMTTNNPADLAKGQGSGVLDEDVKVSLTLKLDTYNGNTKLKVAYINAPGGGGFREKMDQGEAVQAFNGMNLGGVIAAARSKQAPKKPVNEAPQFDQNEEVPF